MAHQHTWGPPPKLLCGLLTLLAAATACGRSPERQRQEAQSQLASWNATFELLAAERDRGAVPERFAEQVRRAGQDELAKAEAQLRRAGGS